MDTSSIDWIHANGTHIVATIKITPGNNAYGADVDLAFDCFCESLRSTFHVSTQDTLCYRHH